MRVRVRVRVRVRDGKGVELQLEGGLAMRLHVAEAHLCSRCSEVRLHVHRSPVCRSPAGACRHLREVLQR